MYSSNGVIRTMDLFISIDLDAFVFSRNKFSQGKWYGCIKNSLVNLDADVKSFRFTGEADRKIATKMPKHMFVGKRKMNKVSRR